MLKILCGGSGSGKTSAILSEIRTHGRNGRSGLILLVPEQYSHEAERRLADFCGDSLSLFGEVLSFSRLANRVFTECGGLSDIVPDKGARLLLMSLAVKSVSGRLRVYARQAGKSDVLQGLLQAREELGSCMISPEKLFEASCTAGGTIGDKLYDMALICEAYDALLAHMLPDARDKLVKLASKIGDSSVSESKIFIDGFTDFTNQELLVIDELMKKDADITVALCVDDNGSEVFNIPFETMQKLIRMAEKRGIMHKTEYLTSKASGKSEALSKVGRTLFDYTVEKSDVDCKDIELYCMSDIVSECEIAACRILELLQADSTLRCGDIAVAARGFRPYRAVCESVFRLYGLPVFISKKTDIMQKPVIALVSEAMKIAAGDWLYSNIFRYLKTNLTGMSFQDMDLLENYCVTWNLRGQAVWTREEPWHMNPRGYVTDSTETDRQGAQYVDRLRRMVANPLKNLSDNGKQAKTAKEQVKALYSFLEEIALAERLEQKSRQLKSSGELQLADEYTQLWDIVVDSMEQCYETLGDTPMGWDEFADLFDLLLSQYDVSSIPVALDRITLGELEVTREKNLRLLVVIGGTDDKLPSFDIPSGLFTADERNELIRLGLDIKDGGDDLIARELHAVYLSLTKPTDKLIITYPQSTGDGKSRPSFIIDRLRSVYGIEVTAESALGNAFRACAPAPAFRLALSGGNTQAANAALYCLKELEPWADKLDSVRRLVDSPRGELSKTSVSKLFGETFHISATRAEKYNTCRFSYFMQYGLRAKPRKRAGFEAPEMGTLVHYVLENVTKEVRKAGGFKVVGTQKCVELAQLYMKQYTEDLLGSAKKSNRFMYLFRRLKGTVERIVMDVAEELARSEFEPLDFELRFDRAGDLPPAVLEDENMKMELSGMVDRVDGWANGGKLYLRVCDYKTGRKTFNLSDVWYGIGLQMLIYLFVLEKHGKEKYRQEIVPAGVLYSPARDIILPMPRGSGDEEIERKRALRLKRSGLILDDPDVLGAMEIGEEPRFIPVSFKNGQYSGSIASAEQIGKLGKHIERLLTQMGGEMKKGSISANPFRAGGKLTSCEYCEFTAACRFNEKKDQPRTVKTLKAQEVWERLYRQ
ncbi:MAG: ATP-dependent nuclease subunit B [Clostridiales bacterium]|nr:ATP-dependent nuclease subunit B [Clostridiales bacterium]